MNYINILRTKQSVDLINLKTLSIVSHKSLFLLAFFEILLRITIFAFNLGVEVLAWLIIIMRPRAVFCSFCFVSHRIRFFPQKMEYRLIQLGNCNLYKIWERRPKARIFRRVARDEWQRMVKNLSVKRTI